MSDLAEQKLDDLEELIVQEKMQAALAYHHDTWASCAAEGIEQEILIDAAIETAVREAIRLQGEDAADKLLSQVRERIIMGDFSPQRVLQ